MTEYKYEDDVNASLVTTTIYPDGNSGTDNVAMEYHLDGLLKKQKPPHQNLWEV